MFTFLNAFSGEQQYFFDGADNSSYGCSCRKTGTCSSVYTETNFCNCDTRIPTLQKDEGIITAMQHLPILEFAYGPYPLLLIHNDLTDFQKGDHSFVYMENNC